MHKSKNNPDRSKFKGNRLQWTPVHEVKSVKLKDLKVSGVRVPDEVIQNKKKFVKEKKSVIIP